MVAIADVPDFDLSLSVAALLREGTAAAHGNIEKSAGAGWLSRGELDKEEYVRFLMMLWHVYRSLEKSLETHSSNSTLQPTYNPSLLSRASNIASDISYLLDVPESEWQEHPIHRKLVSSPSPMDAYVSRLESLTDSSTPELLLAHSYVRYLGDLSGGQTIRRRIAKVYELDVDEMSGIMFYQFKPLSGSGIASMGDLKKIKEWFREGMNAGVGDNRDLKALLLAEANTAFDLNNSLFSSLKAPSLASLKISYDPLPPPLGDPTTPTTPTAYTSEEEDNDSRIVRNFPLMTMGESEKPQAQDKGDYSVTGVMAVIIAAGLAHFIIVVGGFSGQRGYDKLTVVTDWLSGLLGLPVGPNL